LKRVSVSNLKIVRAMNIKLKTNKKKIMPAVDFFINLVDMLSK
jgi:hypothetical protein